MGELKMFRRREPAEFWDVLRKLTNCHWSGQASVEDLPSAQPEGHDDREPSRHKVTLRAEAFECSRALGDNTLLALNALAAYRDVRG